ncbi:hypothetical protein IGJ45_003209 [Enterococcus sp. DIV0574]
MGVKKGKKRLALTSVLTLIITFFLDSFLTFGDIDFLIIYLLVYLVANLHLSE